MVKAGKTGPESSWQESRGHRSAHVSAYHVLSVGQPGWQGPPPGPLLPAPQLSASQVCFHHDRGRGRGGQLVGRGDAQGGSTFIRTTGDACVGLQQHECPASSMWPLEPVTEGVSGEEVSTLSP